MATYNSDKLRKMEDEMNRFESEIGLPNPPVGVHKPVVIGTNTFFQAERKIHEIKKSDDSSSLKSNASVDASQPSPLFIPHQVLQRAHAPQQVIPAPPIQPSVLSANSNGSTVVPPPPLPPGLVFPARPPSVPFLPPHAFPPPGMMTRPSNMSGSPMLPMPFMMPHPGTRYANNFVPGSHLSSVGSKNGTRASDKSPKTPVILSATPKLYTKPQQGNEGSDEQNAQSNIGSDSSYTKTAKKQKNSNTDGKGSNTEGGHPTGKKKDKRNKKLIRVSGGQTWEDPTLTEWEDGDFRLFCGDLGNDVTDELLTRIFSKYPSFLKARVVRDKRTNKTKGFGFISFKDPSDFIRATKEMNGRYVGSRPIKLRKSTWRNRNLDVVKKKEKEKAALIALLTGK